MLSSTPTSGVPHKSSLYPARPAFLDRYATLLSGALLLVGALLLRLYRLDAQSLWLDEGSTWAEVTRKNWPVLLGELLSPNAGYPLYHVLLKGWIALAGDSEWALRFPSALAGALAVVAVWLAGRELAGIQKRRLWLAWVPALLLALSPFVLWFAQEAKAYSLLLLITALELWALLYALRRNTRRSWLLLLGLVIISVFVHRLALFAATGIVCAVALGPGRMLVQRLALIAAGIMCGVGGIAGMIAALRNERSSAHAAAGPLEGLWLTLVRFALDRWPGEIDGYLGLPLLLWLLPCVVLTLVGLVLVIRDAIAGRPAAIALLCLFGMPLVLFSITLAFLPAYEPRYSMTAFPAWILLLSYPLVRNQGENNTSRNRYVPKILLALVVTIVFGNILALFQPEKGLYSGDPLKEQWRESITLVAQRVHPDDLLILHPYYVRPLWEYYAPRVTTDPLPQPVTFPVFAEGFFEENTPKTVREAVRRAYEPFYNQQAYGKQRALLLIAPDHARTVDPPKTLAELQAEAAPGQALPEKGDEYGWVGLRFQYSEQQRTWPCGGAEFVGVALMCQSYPERFGTGTIPEPAIPLDITFGGELQLRGYTLSAAGARHPGGTLPVTLYWAAKAAPGQDYRMFLHLCIDCEQPPLANNDGPPLFGYGAAGRTSTWLIGDPVHDERVLVLPHTLPPGRYTLILGVYSGGGAPETRLAIDGAAQVLSDNRLVLGEVEIVAP